MNIESKLITVNHRKGRGVKPDVIVIHIQAGTMEGTDSWFRNPESQVSAHYGVGKDGEVVQWVADEDQAWHAGTVKNPTAAIVKERAGRSPNTYSLGIECEGQATDEPTLHMLAALGELVRMLAAKHGIPLDRRHVIGHREIRADKTCPGKIDVDQVVATAQMANTVVDPKDEIRAALSEIEEAQDAINKQIDRIDKTLPNL